MGKVADQAQNETGTHLRFIWDSKLALILITAHNFLDKLYDECYIGVSGLLKKPGLDVDNRQVSLCGEPFAALMQNLHPKASAFPLKEARDPTRKESKRCSAASRLSMARQVC